MIAIFDSVFYWALSILSLVISLILFILYNTSIYINLISLSSSLFIIPSQFYYSMVLILLITNIFATLYIFYLIAKLSNQIASVRTEVKKPQDINLKVEERTI